MKTKTRQIPAGYLEVKREGIDAVAYVSQDGTIVKFYTGKKSRADFYIRFASAENAARKIDTYFNHIAETKAAQAAERAERKIARSAEADKLLATLKVGDILLCTWGYSMLLQDFYEVTEVRGRMVRYRKMAKREWMESPYDHYGKCEPVKGQTWPHVGVERTTFVNSGYVNTDGHPSKVWDGTPAHWDHND